MKEKLYEQESKNSEIELQFEEQKNELSDKINQLKKDLGKSKDGENDLNKKYA